MVPERRRSSPDVRALGPEVWTAANPPETNGLVILGTPLGTTEFVNACGVERMQQEQRMLQEISKMEDPPSAWTMLCMSAVPRANHTARILPPSTSRFYTDARDDAVWHTFCDVLNVQTLVGDGIARRVATYRGD